MASNSNIPEQKEQYALEKGSLCALHGLKSMPSMNGKLCKIVGELDDVEQRYPVLVIETHDVVLLKPSNLKAMDRGTIYINDIRIYPIKGCKQMSLAVSKVLDSGLQYDREYCLMSTLKRPKILNCNNNTALIWVQSIPDEGGIRISAPGMKGSIYVRRRYEEKDRVCPKYWNYREGISGFDQGNVASEWITKYLCLHNHNPADKIRLILLDPHFQRRTHANVTSEQFCNENANRNSVVRFQNEFQFLAVSQESVDGLNVKMREQKSYNAQDDKIKIDRFRPSLVLSSNGDLPPHFEDTTKMFVAGDIKFYHTKPCDRCAVPTINMQTGVRHRKLKPTLMDYRTGQHLGYLKEPNWKMKVFFGSYFIHQKNGVIRRGTVLKT